MDAERLKKEIADLEEKVITKIDYHFNWYIMIDYSEIPDFHYLYLIDDYDWYLYWIDVERDILGLLDYLIPVDDGLIDETQNVLSMKRIVDKKLLELSDNDDNQIYIDLDLIEDPNKRVEADSNYIKLNVYGDDLDEAISIFYSYLRSNGFISNNRTVSFDRNFRQTDQVLEKMVWKKNMNQLVGMLKYLIQVGYIFGDPSEIPAIIDKHFTIRRLSGSTNVESIQKTVAKVNFNKSKPGVPFNFIYELAKKLDPIRAK